MKLKLKTYLSIGLILLITLFMARPWIEKGINHLPGKDYDIDFVDDSGYRIRMEKPADTIISLYSAHTENLFALGLDREIIGVGTSDVYPFAALSKDIYDYRSDPEKVIAARPDVVIIRPFIERHSPDFVKSLRRTGITVVSLYPDNFDEFDAYIMKLGYVTGRESTAEKKLKAFHEELASLGAQTVAISSPVGVYFESSDREYKTVTITSMPAKAIELAGGINVAVDAVPVEEGSSIAIYGTEKIIEKAKDIDVYVTQRGVMGAGGNTHSISIRPGFDVIEAVKKGRVLEINQKIISSPTFRLTKGVKTLQRFFYPEIFDSYEVEGEITRAALSDILIKHLHEPIFIPTASYFRDTSRDHYYGALVDVTIEHPHFDSIETAIQKGFFDSTIEDEQEYFYPERGVTRETFARILYVIGDYNNQQVDIEDIDDLMYPRIVQTIIAEGLMTLDEGYFNPTSFITAEDVKRGLSHD